MHPKLKNIKECMKEFQNTYPEDACLYLCDENEVIVAMPGKSFDLKIEEGTPMESINQSVTYKALKSGKTLREEKGAEVFGVPYISTAQPIYDEGRVIGVLSAVISNKKVGILRAGAHDLGSAVQQMTATGEEMIAASSDIAVKLQELSERSESMKEDIEQIHSILGLVKGIAKQSNILGLNASIEAARSGEYGKGFTVVAKEIRKMADSSNERVLEIEKQLETIKEAIEQMNESTNTIAAFTEEHNASMQQLANTYEQIGKTSETLLEASKITI